MTSAGPALTATPAGARGGGRPEARLGVLGRRTGRRADHGQQHARRPQPLDDRRGGLAPGVGRAGVEHDEPGIGRLSERSWATARSRAAAVLRAPPGCTALRPRRTTGWADGHGTATAGGVESVTSVLRVDDGAVSTKFARPAEPDRQQRAAVGGRVDDQPQREPVRQHGLRRRRRRGRAVHRHGDGVGPDRPGARRAPPRPAGPDRPPPRRAPPRAAAGRRRPGRRPGSRSTAGTSSAAARILCDGGYRTGSADTMTLSR